MTPITTIKEDFKKVIQYSQGFENVQVDELFDRWAEAKRDIIEAWGGNYIIEVVEPVCFELSPREKEHRINEFIDSIDNTYRNTELVEFLDWLHYDEIFSNHLEREYWLDYDGHTKIAKGTKVSKAFKYFESDEKALRDIQDQLSMIIQEDKISGTLCFSVHPLDFLSASENTYHWRSCHALDGDYRSGNLSYMLDKSTIICYLRKVGEMVKLPHFPEDVLWNSKKWRMWLYLSDDWNAMFAGRQYPFFSPTALDKVQFHLLKTLNFQTSRHWTPWYDDYITEFPRKNSVNASDDYVGDKVLFMANRVYKMRDLVIDCQNPLHFNDLLSSSCYVPYYSWNRVRKQATSFHIGGQVPCLCCNGRDNLNYSSSMLCHSCAIEFGEGEDDNYAYCHCCDSRVAREDMHYVHGLEGYVCPDCFERETALCDSCGEYWYSPDITYDHKRQKYMCPECRAYFERNPEAEERVYPSFFSFDDDDLPF